MLQYSGVRYAIGIVVAVMLFSGGFLTGKHELSAGAKPSKQTLFEKTIELPEKRVNVQVHHLKLPAGFKTPEHTHPGPGPRFIIKGKMEVIEGGETGVFNTGEVFWESGALMTAENLSSEPAEVVIVELLPVQ